MACVAVFVLLAGAVAAQDAGVPMPEVPGLPPTANWIVKRFKIERTSSVYDTRMKTRKKIAAWANLWGTYGATERSRLLASQAKAWPLQIN